MSKEDLVTWHQGVVAFDANRFQEAIQIMRPVASSVGAKIHFNMGICYGALKQHKEAIDCYTSAVKADKYFAAAFFMRGFHQTELRAFDKAVQDYDNAVAHLRGNLLIDYEQLGMDFKLFLCEALYNRAFCHYSLGRRDAAQQDLAQAQEAKMEPQHDVVDTALRSLSFGKLFVVPPKCLYRPPETKIKNAEKVNYLGKSKVVAAVDDTITGFQGAVMQRQQAAGGSPVLSDYSSSPGSGGGRAGMPAPPPPSSRAGMPAPAPPGPNRVTQGFAPRPGPPPGGSGPRPGPPPAGARPPPGGAYRPGPPGPRPAGPPGPRSGGPPAGGPGPRPPVSAAPTGGGFSGGIAGKIKVKCHAKDTRIVVIDEGTSYAEFKKRVSEKFDGQSFKFKYRDEDGDQVLLTDDEDLAMALACSETGKLEIWCK